MLEICAKCGANSSKMLQMLARIRAKCSKCWQNSGKMLEIWATCGAKLQNSGKMLALWQNSRKMLERWAKCTISIEIQYSGKVRRNSDASRANSMQNAQSGWSNFSCKFLDQISGSLISVHGLSLVPTPLRSPPILLAGLG